MAKADGSVIIDIKGNASDITSKLNGVASGAVKGLTAAFSAASAAAAAFVAESVNVGMSFDASMSRVAATMGVTTGEIQNLRDFAMEMGTTTAFSATQAADALNYMALAGYDAETSMAMLPNVLNLAAAGGIDLARASDMVTDAQSALGLSISETAAMVDKMAMASSKSNTSVAQLGEAFLTVGGTAKNLAGGTTELATALGILADNGVKGADGGTALRNIILSLTAPTDQAAEALESLGVSAFDAEGNMRPLNDTFKDLNDALSTMSQGAQTQVLNEIFNKVDLKSVNALLANSGERFDELAESIDNAAGAAERMAKTQLDNLAGDITLMKSALEGLQISVSDKITPYLRDVVQALTEVIGKAQEFIGSGGIEGIVSSISNMIPVVVAATGILASFKAGLVIQNVVHGFQQAQVAVSLLTLQIGQANLAQAALNGTLAIGETVVALLTGKMTLAALAQAAMAKAQLALNAVMSANPILLVVGAIGSLIAITTAYVMATGDAENETRDFIQSLQDSKAAYDDLVSSSQQEKGAFEGTAESLANLLGVEEKSAAQKAVITQKVNELNQALPGLGLAYDDVSDSINMTTEQLTSFAAAQANQKKYEADVQRLSELYDERAEISDRLSDAENQLSEAQEKHSQMMAASAGNMGTYDDALFMAGFSVAELQSNVEGLTAAQEQNNTEIAQLEASTNAYAEAAANAASAAGEISGEAESQIQAAESVGEAVMAMAQAYHEAYDAAYSGISQTVGLFNEVDGAAKASVESLSATLDQQISFISDYADNIAAAMEKGIDQGLVESLSDGSEQSAQILASLVTATDEQVQQINEKFAQVQEGKDKFADAVGEMVSGVDEELSGLPEDVAAAMTSAVAEMDVSGEAEAAGRATVAGLIKGIDSEIGNAEGKAAELGEKVLAAYKSAVDQHSPSREFEKAGRNDVLGLINGANGNTTALEKAYGNVGKTAVHAVAQGILNASEAVEKATNEMGERVSNGLTGIMVEEVAALEKQVEASNKFYDNLAKLEARNAPEALVEQLKDMDVDAAATLQHLVNMTDEELDNYAKLFERRQELEQSLAKDSEDEEKDKEKEKEKADQKWFEALKKRLERETKYKDLTLQEQYKGWKTIQDQFLANSEYYAQAEEQIYDLRKRIQDEYYKKVSDTLKNIESLEESYQKEFSSRVQDIEKEYGLFTRVSEREVVSGDYLTRTLKGQIATLEEFYNNLDALAARGAPAELVEQIRDMGVDAVDELAALNSMSDKQLAEYSELFEKKHRLAVHQATKELEPLREETDAKIKEQLDSVKELYDQNVDTVGEAFTAGLAESILDGLGDVSEAAQKVVRQSLAAAAREASAFKSVSIGGLQNTISRQLKNAVEASAANLSASLTVASNAPAEASAARRQASAAQYAAAGAYMGSGNNAGDVVINVDGQKFFQATLSSLRSVVSANPAVRDDK